MCPILCSYNVFELLLNTIQIMFWYGAMSVSWCIMHNIHLKCRLFYDKIIANFCWKAIVIKIGFKYLIFNFLFISLVFTTIIAESSHLIQLLFAKKDIILGHWNSWPNVSFT